MAPVGSIRVYQAGGGSRSYLQFRSPETTLVTTIAGAATAEILRRSGFR